MPTQSGSGRWGARVVRGEERWADGRWAMGCSGCAWGKTLVAGRWALGRPASDAGCANAKPERGRRRTVEARRARAALPLRLDLPRVELDAKVHELAGARVLQQVAPARLVGVRKGRRALEGVGVALIGDLGALVLLGGLAERLARPHGHARDSTLAVEGHDLVRDQRVGHARVVLGPLHEPAAVGDDLLDGIVEQPLEDGVVFPQAGEQRLGPVERAGDVKLPLGGVGLARRLVALEVAEPLALLAQAPLGRGVGDDLGRRRRRVGVGNVREARRRAAALLGDAAHEQTAGALLHGRALDDVDAEVEAKVDEARQRDALLGVLRSHRCSGFARGPGPMGSILVLGLCVGNAGQGLPCS